MPQIRLDQCTYQLNSSQLTQISTVMAGTLRQMIARRRSSGVNEYVAAMKNVNLENVSTLKKNTAIQTITIVHVLEGGKLSV